MIDNLLSDMRRKYQHAQTMGWDGTKSGCFLSGAPITKQVLEHWIPLVENAKTELDKMEDLYIALEHVRASVQVGCNGVVISSAALEAVRNVLVDHGR